MSLKFDKTGVTVMILIIQHLLTTYCAQGPVSSALMVLILCFSQQLKEEVFIALFYQCGNQGMDWIINLLI